MPLKKITEKETAASASSEAHVLLTQPEVLEEGADPVESLRRVPVAKLAERIAKLLKLDDTYFKTEEMEAMKPFIVRDVEEIDGGIRFVFWDGTQIDIAVESGGLAFDSMSYDESNNLLHILLEGEDVVDPVYIPGGGGGGGGSSNNATVSISNTTGWITKTIGEDADCVLTGTWSSLENEMPTGNGSLSIKIEGVTKASVDIPQGDFSINIKQYLTTGTNKVRMTITDVYGNAKSINFTVNVVALSLASNFDATKPFDGAIAYTFVPKGNVDKVMHFILDGEELEGVTISASGRQSTYRIPQQPHGAHSFEVYFTAEIDGQPVDSNHLYYDLICVEEGNNTPIIASAFNKTELSQYETVGIQYIVYNPASLTSAIVLKEGDNIVAELTVDRTMQTWAFRADNPGALSLKIVCGQTVKEFLATVSATTIGAEATIEDLELHLSSYGRSNNEANPAHWESGDIACTFAGYNWRSDGWQQDEDGTTVHRVTGDARLTIPLEVFKDDFRTTGKTIELEFATRNVLNYDATIVSCFSGDRGLKLTAQKALLKSAQSEISTQYKENEHVRLSFVVEKRAEYRLIYIYINGIMCGATQYPADDDFSQAAPVGITIGSNDCTIDLYTVRVYSNDLTRHQVLENWIADTQDITLKLERYNRNNVYDAYGAIVIDKLPNDLPYMVLQAPALPTFKGNKLNVDGYYVDPQNEAKSFEFEGAQADVQGTSSAGYARKNYKIKFKNGFNIGGVIASGYAMRADSIPTGTFTFKADVASSEGANNVELVRLYNAICPYRTPPQKVNERVRQGIDGFPIVIFHDNGSGVAFVGKYNFNNDKGTPEVFGFTEGDESWEILNNTSNRVLFKSANFSGDDWLNDFEARYPEDNVDSRRLAAFVSWVVSTDQAAATDRDLEDPITYDGVRYTQDTAAYRLAKFKAELENHAELDSAVFYYLFTELFLMVDSRAKNAFPSEVGGDKICWLPYDMDTAIGINNEGALAFGYELEDIDQTAAGADIYNGQQSVFWINLRQAFGDKIREMYQTLRSDNVLSYDIVEEAFEEHQRKWCEAIWNEDAYYKYLQPLIESNTSVYLSMLQGSKSEQRKWWLYNRFRYIDSKYNAGDAQSDFVTLRGYSVADITVEPYADIYASIKYGSYLVQERALRGNQYTLECPLDSLNDTEIYIYSASQLKGIGDLSPLKVGFADFSMATKLTALKLGDASEDYENGNLAELYLGNNALLQTIDVRNCQNLGTGTAQQSVDLSGCMNIENVYFDGTAVTGVALPNGGILKVLHLPATITNLTIMNQNVLTEFSVPSYEGIATLRLENVSDVVDTIEILKAMAANSRVRLIGVNWAFETPEEALELYELLDTMRGLDEAGNNTDKAQVSGSVYIPSLTGAQLATMQEKYPDISVTYDDISFLVTFKDHDGTVLHTETVVEGATVTDPVANGTIEAPTREGTEDTGYTYSGWNFLPEEVHADTTITAQYAATYAVKFFNGTTLLATDWVEEGGTAEYTGAEPTKPQTAQYKYNFYGWAAADGGAGGYSILNNITAPKSVFAAFSSEIRRYTVKFYNGSTLLKTVEEVAYGGSAQYTGDAPTSSVEGEEFSGWNPQPTNIQGDTNCYAVFVNPNALDAKTWEEIRTYSDAGTAANYFSVGDRKAITLNGLVGVQDFNNVELYVYILGFNHNSALEGDGITFGTFKSAKTGGNDIGLADVLNYGKYPTDGTKTFNINHWGYNNYGGWAACDARYDILGSTDTAPSGYGANRASGAVGYDASPTTATNPVPNTLMAALPADLRAVMKPMTIYTDNVAGGSGSVESNITATIDYLPLLSEFEVFGTRSGANEYEQQKQAQYAYYAAGNSKVKRRHDTGATAIWWERSPHAGSNHYFRFVISNGSSSNSNAYYSYLLAPAFKV